MSAIGSETTTLRVQIECSVDDLVYASDNLICGTWTVIRDVSCYAFEIFESLSAKSDGHALRMPKREKKDRIFSGEA